MFKVIAERWYSTKQVSFYSFSVASIVSVIMYIFFEGFSFSPLGLYTIIILSFFNVLFYYTSILSRVESMRHIDTVIFYPIYKTIWPILVTLISVFVFLETLSLKEWFWILAGICVPLLLITKTENRIQKNLKLGCILIVVTAIFWTLSAVTPKLILQYGYNMNLFTCITFLFGIVFSGITYFLEKKKEKKYTKTWLVKFSLLMGFMHYLAFITFNYAMGWNFAIAFTINSFGILIPIILSIIFYGEHFNLKKGIVIALSIISILLFI